MEKFAPHNARFCGCQACAARVRQNSLRGPWAAFLAVSRCSSWGRFAARVGFWHLRRFRGPLHAVGGGLLPWGVCVGGGRRAFWRCFAGAIFWSERWSGSQSACAVAGAGARARPGGGLPTLSEPVAEPSSLGRRHSRDNNDHIDVVLTNTLERRAAYPSTCAVGEHRVRARPDGGAACPVGAGGRAVRARGAATVRSGAVWRCFCSQHFFGRNAGAALRAPAVPWQVQERVRGLAGGLPTRPEPVAEPSGLGRRHSALACVERSTSWW